MKSVKSLHGKGQTNKISPHGAEVHPPFSKGKLLIELVEPVKVLETPVDQDPHNNTIHSMDPVAVVKVEPTEIATPAERLKIGDLSGFANQSDRVYNKVFQSFKGTKTRKLSLKPLADNVVLPANDPENVVSAALPVAALAPEPTAKNRDQRQ